MAPYMYLSKKDTDMKCSRDNDGVKISKEKQNGYKGQNKGERKPICMGMYEILDIGEVMESKGIELGME